MIGLVVVQRGIVTIRESYSVQAVNATQVEAKAICKGLEIVASQLCEGGRLFTDSLELVNALAQGLPVVPNWRVSKELWDAWRTRTAAPNFIEIAYKSRENVFIRAAHVLANEGRHFGCNRQGGHYLLARRYQEM